MRDVSVVITGGGSGLGAGAARVFATAGAHVSVWDKVGERAKAVADEIGGAWRALDVCDHAAVDAAFEVVAKQEPPLRHVVHCAGIGDQRAIYGPDGPHPVDIFERIVGVNLIGAFNVLRAGATQIAQTAAGVDGARGSLVFVSSASAEDAPGGMSAYAASKAGVNAMMLCAARDLGSYGVRVNAIAPGLFDTPLLHQDLPDETLAAMARRAPFPKRFGTPEEFGQMALAICVNPMMNAAVVRLDGGMRFGQGRPR